MMHRESGSYFHFLLRGWLISYYIVHQRPVISDSFREESTCAKIHGPKIQGCDHRAEIQRTVPCVLTLSSLHATGSLIGFHLRYVSSSAGRVQRFPVERR